MPALILLPGLDGTGRLFAPLLRELPLSLDARVVSYSTTRVQSYAELEALAAESLPTDEPYILLGESFSGPIALSLAARRPQGLVGIVLVCSFARCPVPMLRYAKRLASVLPIHLVPTRIIAHAAFGGFGTSTLTQLLREAVGSVAPAVLRARLRAIADVDVRAALADVTVPILDLRASEDRLVPPSASALICSVAASVTSVSIDGPHFLLQARPAEVARHLTDFAESAA